MSRKDTIIIAVLINAGLLIVLFASALKTSSPQVEASAAPMAKYVEPSYRREQPVASGGDEVDQALQIAQSSSAPAVKESAYFANAQSSSPYSASSPASSAPKMNFADDLKAFAAPEVSSTAFPAVATTQAVEKKNAEYVEIKVKKGDVLEKIARQHRTSVDQIIALNQLSTTSLRIGQTLKIPQGKSAVVATTSSAAAPSASQTSGSKYYVVRNGDNPWTIAVKNHMKVEDLLKLNNLDQEKARKLKPGDKLLIQ